MASKSNTFSRAMTAAWLVILAVAGGIVGCTSQQPAPALDLTTVAPCDHEDGPAVGGPVPCVWDGATRGNTAYTQYRWVLYVTECPVPTVQDSVRCVGRSDWS